MLRPNLADAERRAAVLEAFRHLGKAYDFEFDFNVPARLVCTELIYRSFHGRGKITLPLIKRLGRYTLTCDDIIRWLLEEVDAAGCPRKRPVPSGLPGPARSPITRPSLFRKRPCSTRSAPCGTALRPPWCFAPSKSRAPSRSASTSPETARRLPGSSPIHSS